MICPHCRTSLPRKERTDSVCSHCELAFALDPKVHGRGMHDTRIERIARLHTDEGRRTVTLTQLWYLARAENRTWDAAARSGRSPWVGRTAAVVLVAGLAALAVRLPDSAHAGLIWWGSVGAAVVVYLMARGRPRRPARRAGAYVLPYAHAFRSMMLGRWVEVYGGLPPGVVDEEKAGDAAFLPTDRDRQERTVALLCPDRAVRVFLSVNDFPHRLELTLVARLADLPPSGPVVVLHDASARGFQLLADVRANRPDAVVVDAGLPVKAVRGNRRAVVLHEDPPESVGSGGADWLRRMERLAPADAAWLRLGWLSPVAAVPPALLEAAVARGVERARSAPDPARRRAAELGFLSWPQPPEPEGI
ncbi:hypothetical protein ACWC10_17450 [Streptomyces sp. NPDC001595]|uniref:hypothetical protein n=1 Tax=Streptomyces sp. NPDC001532 TaxID=3154520 RepID=UPI003329AC03